MQLMTYIKTSLVAASVAFMPAMAGAVIVNGDLSTSTATVLPEVPDSVSVNLINDSGDTANTFAFELDTSGFGTPVFDVDSTFTFTLDGATDLSFRNLTVAFNDTGDLLTPLSSVTVTDAAGNETGGIQPISLGADTLVTGDALFLVVAWTGDASGSGASLFVNNIAATTVPLPATALLLIGAMGVVGAMGMRRKA
ncbi:MAG: hypothetical protein AAGI70_11725 [Pseudomonadota bacterium]